MSEPFEAWWRWNGYKSRQHYRRQQQIAHRELCQREGWKRKAQKHGKSAR